MNDFASENATKEKYCLYYNCNINGCNSVTCFLYSSEKHGCRFSDIDKKIEIFFKTEFKATCDEARRVARTLLLNSYRPESNPNNLNNKRRK